MKKENYEEIVMKMLKSTKIINNLQKLIDSDKFQVSTNNEQLLVKKKTHHKFNNIIVFEEKCFIPKLEIYYKGDKSDDYYISTIPTLEQTIMLRKILKMFHKDKKVIIKF